MNLRPLLGTILITMAVVYIVLSAKDVKHEFRMVFSRKLVRRYLTRFTIRSLLVSTIVAAGSFAMIHQLAIPKRDWPLLFIGIAVFLGFIVLCTIAYRDTTFKGAKRIHPDRLPVDEEPPGS